MRSPRRSIGLGACARRSGRARRGAARASVLDLGAARRARIATRRARGDLGPSPEWLDAGDPPDVVAEAWVGALGELLAHAAGRAVTTPTARPRWPTFDADLDAPPAARASWIAVLPDLTTRSVATWRPPSRASTRSSRRWRSDAARIAVAAAGPAQAAPRPRVGRLPRNRVGPSLDAGRLRRVLRRRGLLGHARPRPATAAWYAAQPGDPRTRRSGVRRGARWAGSRARSPRRSSASRSSPSPRTLRPVGWVPCGPTPRRAGRSLFHDDIDAGYAGVLRCLRPAADRLGVLTVGAGTIDRLSLLSVPYVSLHELVHVVQGAQALDRAACAGARCRCG